MHILIALVKLLRPATQPALVVKNDQGRPIFAQIQAKTLASTGQAQLKSSSSMKSDHNSFLSASKKLKSTPNHKTLKEYCLQMNINATTIKLFLAHKHINGDNLRPAVTSGNDHKMNASKHWTLTMNANANTSPLLIVIFTSPHQAKPTSTTLPLLTPKLANPDSKGLQRELKHQNMNCDITTTKAILVL